MYCYKCGTQFDDNANFCPQCGAKAPNTENKPVNNAIAEPAKKEVLNNSWSATQLEDMKNNGLIDETTYDKLFTQEVWKFNQLKIKRIKTLRILSIILLVPIVLLLIFWGGYLGYGLTVARAYVPDETLICMVLELISIILMIVALIMLIATSSKPTCKPGIWLGLSLASCLIGLCAFMYIASINTDSIIILSAWLMLHLPTILVVCLCIAGFCVCRKKKGNNVSTKLA